MQEKHSGLGIASFTLSILGSLLMFLLFVIAGIMEAATPGGIDEESAEAIFVGLIMIATFFFNLIAIALGVTGLFQKQRKKLFAILGTALSGLTVVLASFLMLIGLLIG